jgi:hypothetical protein
VARAQPSHQTVSYRRRPVDYLHGDTLLCPLEQAASFTCRQVPQP